MLQIEGKRYEAVLLDKEFPMEQMQKCGFAFVEKQMLIGKE